MSEESNRKLDLRNRTKVFAGAIVRLFCSLEQRRTELMILGKQVIRAGTSVGANYREASRARSKAEFLAKIELCAQEADDVAHSAKMAPRQAWSKTGLSGCPNWARKPQTQYWLELLRDECAIPPASIDPIWHEADELISIFVAMAKKTKDGRGI